jgi:hypothetical protein
MARKRKPKFEKFEIPNSFLEQIYELTGGADKNKGFILCFIDENGMNQIKSKFDSQASEFSTIKNIEIFINQYNANYEMQFMGTQIPESDEDDD